MSASLFVTHQHNGGKIKPSFALLAVVKLERVKNQRVKLKSYKGMFSFYVFMLFKLQQLLHEHSYGWRNVMTQKES